MSPDGHVLHVERTGDPSVLRWVCHRPDLDATPVPPRGSTLDALVGSGHVDVLAVRGGDLLVRFGGGVAQSVVAEVHRAVVETIDNTGWSAPTEESPVSLRPRHARG